MNNPGKDGMGRGRGRGMRRENQAIERRDHRRSVDPAEKSAQDASSSHELMQRGSASSVQPSFVNADGKSTSDVSKTSKLSADAKEFYPKGYMPQQDHNIQRSGEDQEVKSRIGELMASLTRDPGEFDRALTPLREKFVLWLQNPGAVHTMVDDIVEQSIVENNFRYNGARLCSFLYNLSASIPASAFRSYLIGRCTKLPSASSEDSHRLNGVAIFLAELFMQVEEGEGGVSGGKGRRIKALGEQLFALLERLVAQALAANAHAQNAKVQSAVEAAESHGEGLKCVCQALKLAGWQLEEMDRLRMTQLSNDLAHAAGGYAGERGVRRIATAVGELRRAGWGRRNYALSGETTTVASPAAQIHCRGVEGGGSQWHGGSGRGRGHFNSNVDDPVFYGPDGQILTAEESNFLQDSIAAIYDDESGDGEWGDSWSDGGMDEEMEAAFEQFLQLGQKSTTA
ncbi:polyadenylate-binding protein-interacting protein 1 [Ischnura elegans]|uniref:polyadenylate-binding protein-interacting protein 1 n=1 Tax=Ischnura elegans TaxID=197161 RepID=UPI001ED88DBD|nr:polyadenylate-binding protein-interacting protein 1 [Ischnura elegans]XP_046385557.1 polyadenylate-binding protein-interacting protein 1 [Ischnura elegans]